MASIINADSGISSSVTGITFSADNSGALNIQTNGVTAIAISSSQAVSFPATTSLNFGSANITTLTSSSATITNLIATSASITTLTNNPTFGAGTANGMLYLNGSKVITSGSGVVFDGTNMGVGVTPSAWTTNFGIKVLQVGPRTSLVGATANTNVAYNIYFDGTDEIYIANGVANSYLQDGGAHKWFIAASGNAGAIISSTQAMTLDASGRLGIGTTSLNERVNVAAGSAAGAAISFRGNGASSTTELYVGQGASNEAYVFNRANQHLVLATNNSERLRITAGGLVGIGNSSPSNSQVVITGQSAYTANTYFATRLNSANYADSGGYTTMLGFGVEPAVWSKAAIGFTRTASYDVGYLAFYVNSDAGSGSMVALADERARITSGGVFQVNTTSSSYGGAQARCDINGGGTASLVVTTSGGAGYGNIYCHNTATSGDNTFIDFGTEAAWTSRGSITYNRSGGLVAYNTTSDYRAKDVFGPLVDSGNTIDALKVYTGKMKDATVERPMLIAHEAQEVVPYAVTGEKDAVNDDGTPKYQQMDHQILVPLLIAEIQSLRARVAALEGV